VYPEVDLLVKEFLNAVNEENSQYLVVNCSKFLQHVR